MHSTPTGERSWFVPAAIVAGVLGSVVVLVMLGSQVSGILSTVGSSVGGDSIGSDPDAGSGGDTSGGSGGDSTAPGVVTASARDGALIIKTGAMSLQVAAIDAAVTAATQRIDALGGYASGSQRAGTGDEAEATITFRVPAERWDDAMNGVRALADQVLSEGSTTEDVTTQVVDLGARIRNLQATEQALQAIMDRAAVIEDVLSVQAELTTVRGTIEQLTAQKAHLEAQAALSTLTVTFAVRPIPVLVEQRAQFDPAGEVDAASATFVSILQRLVKAGIWFAIVWLPSLLGLAIGAVIAFLVIRRLRKLLPIPAREG